MKQLKCSGGDWAMKIRGGSKRAESGGGTNVFIKSILKYF